jgi:hypothetical protein
LTIIETTYKRTVGCISSDNSFPDTWAISTNAAVGLLSNELVDFWGKAIIFAPITRRRTSSYHNFHYRIFEATIVRVQTKLPIVRTRCLLQDNSYDNTTTLKVFDHNS